MSAPLTTHVSPSDRVRLTVSLLDGCGRFEICEGDSSVVEGRVRRLESPLGPAHQMMMEASGTQTQDGEERQRGVSRLIRTCVNCC